MGIFEFNFLFEITGIENLISFPTYTPHQVVVVERRHHHVVSTAITLCIKLLYHLPFGVLHVIKQFFINRMITSNSKDKCPYKILFQESPNYDNIKSFRCLCYPWLNPYEQNMLD